MLKQSIIAAILATAGLPVAATAAEFQQAHDAFRDAFNARDWDAIRTVLADDVVFHRAAAHEVFVGEDAVIEHFRKPITEEWNVTFTALDTSEEFTGKDGRAVERGDFAITAGAAGESCYRGSYLMTWAPASDGWQLQALTWQDLETEPANC